MISARSWYQEGRSSLAISSSSDFSFQRNAPTCLHEFSASVTNVVGTNHAGLVSMPNGLPPAQLMDSRMSSSVTSPLGDLKRTSNGVSWTLQETDHSALNSSGCLAAAITQHEI